MFSLLGFGSYLGSLEVLALRGVLGSHHYPVAPEGLVEPVRLI